MVLIKDLGMKSGSRYGVYKCNYCNIVKKIRTQSVLQGQSDCNCKLNLIETILPLQFISIDSTSHKIKWNVKCACGENFSAVRSYLLNRAILKCGKCSRNESFGTSKLNVEYIRELFIKRPDITVLEEYKGSNTPISHKHSCGYIWDIVPDTLLNTKGIKCHNCVHNGSFEIGKSTKLYFIKLTNYELYKIGITKHTIQERYKYENCDIDKLYEHEFPCGRLAYEMEQSLLQKFKQYKTLLPSPFKETSNTEILDTNILKELKCYMESHLKK